MSGCAHETATKRMISTVYEFAARVRAAFLAVADRSPALRAAAAARACLDSASCDAALRPSFFNAASEARARFRDPAFSNSPATWANISLNRSDHAACASPARTRASSITSSIVPDWTPEDPRSRSHAALNHSMRL